MRTLALATVVLTFIGTGSGHIEQWMSQAFYPTLLFVLIVASLGVPIPEDVPLILAGVLLKTHDGIASWPGTIFVALLGIMSGDLVLYYFGRRWGDDVVNHRSVRWLITPARFRMAAHRFGQYGMWFCFFGRFFMGVRAAMCLTAGATRFRYWKFFLADFAGALITVPLWMLLGHWFAGKLDLLQAYTSDAKGILTALLAAALLGAIIYFKVRAFRRAQRAGAAQEKQPGAVTKERPLPHADALPAARSTDVPIPPPSDGPRSKQPVPAKL